MERGLNEIIHYKMLGQVVAHGGYFRHCTGHGCERTYPCVLTQRMYMYLCRCLSPPCTWLKILMVGIEGGKLKFTPGGSLCREGGKAPAERWGRTVGHEEIHNGLNWPL